MAKWKILQNKDVSLHPRWMRLQRQRVRTSRGAVIEEFYVHTADQCVIVIAPAPDGRIICTREYAHAIGKTLLRFPAGMMEKGETPAEAAYRELLEETGYKAAGLKKACVTYPTPDRSNQPMHVFTAVRTVLDRPHQEATEDIAVELYSPTALDAIALKGGIKSSEHAAAWLAARRKYVK